MKAEMDGSEVRQLELDLRGAPARVKWGITETLKTKVGPLLAKEMRQDARGHRGNWFGKPGTSYPTHLERHVSHELIDPSTVEAGIENKGAGALGHIIAYGSVKNDPVYDPMSGPRRALPRIGRMFETVVEDSVLGDD